MLSKNESYIAVKNLTKKYEIYNAPYKRLLQTIFMGHKQFYKEFYALQDVSFNVKQGECLGVIGRNGAGKSTLLALLSGALHTQDGSVECNGKVSSLLELGFGFNRDFTGRENIKLAALMYGITRKELQQKIDSIIEFAEIGEFIDQPVKSYSSGMFVRLAFAVIANVDANLLLIDEALAVGDIFFQQKCYRFLEQQKQSSAMVLVSHDLNAISTLCDRVLVLDHGHGMFLGDTREAIEFYTHLLYSDEAVVRCPEVSVKGNIPMVDSQHCTGDDGIFCAATVYNEKDEVASVCRAGEIVQVVGVVKLLKACPKPIVGFFFNDRFGRRVFGECTSSSRALKAGMARFSFELEWPDITPGEYTLTLGLGCGEDVMTQKVYCWATDFMALNSIKERGIVHGIFNVKMNNFDCGNEDGND